MRVTILTTIGFAILISIASIYLWMNRIEIKAQENYFVLINKFTGNHCIFLPYTEDRYDPAGPKTLLFAQ